MIIRHLARPLILLAATALFTSASLLAPPSLQAQEKQRTVQSVFADAVKLYEAGDYTGALAGFQTVLKYKPGYVYARSYSAKCKQALKEGRGGHKQNLEANLAKLVVPTVKFEEASLDMVMEFLTQKSEELSKGKVVANFIYKGSAENRKNITISLNLRNTPFTDVVRYVGQLSRTRFTYDEFAIVGTPLGTGTTASSTAEGAKGDTATNLTPGELKPIPPAGSDPFRKR